MRVSCSTRLRYPLLWIIDVMNPELTKAVPNPSCKKIPKFASFREWLNNKYKKLYQYHLTDYLQEYGPDLNIRHYIGLRVTGTLMLDAKFYRRSWCEVAVDVFMRVYMDVFTGNEFEPECHKVAADYRIRGYYDLDNNRCRLY